MTMNVKILSLFVLMALSPVAVSAAHADAGYTEKLEFGAALEEALGHFWAIEQNLDDNNATLALVHATHPIAELYDSMKPVLKEKSPALDMTIQTTLSDLGSKATTDVRRADAHATITDARGIIDMTQSEIIDAPCAGTTERILALHNTLIENSLAEFS